MVHKKFTFDNKYDFMDRNDAGTCNLSLGAAAFGCVNTCAYSQVPNKWGVLISRGTGKNSKV